MPATNAAPWEKQLRQLVKASHGRGWGLAPHRGGRTQLRRRWDDGTTSSITLATPWAPSSVPALLAAVEQIAARIKADPALPLADAAEQLQLTSAPAAGAAAVRNAAADWPDLVERYRQHLIQAGMIQPRTWGKHYRPYLSELMEVMQRRPAPRTGKGALEQLLKAHPTASGGTGRRHRLGSSARFLRWAVKDAGLAERYLPPDELSDLIGQRLEAKQQGVPLPDRHAVRIWRAVPDPRWRLAIGLLICFGLRPAELDHLQVEGKGLRVGGVKRNRAGAKGSRLVPPLDPLEAPGMGAELLAVLAERGREGLPTCKSPHWPSALFRQLRALPEWHVALEEAAAMGQGKLTTYGCRHGYAWRGGQVYRLTPRVLAAAMGHSVAIHLQAYGEGAAADEVMEAVAAARDRVLQS